MPGDWVYGAIAVLTLLHGIVLLYAYRRGKADGTRDARAEESDTDAGVECRSCGEHNEEGYRYCRQCVSELPAGTSFLSGPSTPETRRTL